MFKPLLRTLPSLSGNFALACPVNYITRNSIDDFTVNIRTAKMIPLQNYVSAPKVNDIDLLNNKYEYDVYKYYKNLSLSEYFYDSKRTITIDIFEPFNLIANNDFSPSSYNSRDTDYEFGTKRISYSQHGYQFMFYAPIYIDDVNSIPETFEIRMSYSDVFLNETEEKVVKKITINIGKKTVINYLRTYLNNYLKKIDQKVVTINEHYKNGTYYGIDVKNGGLQEYQYNIISKLFSTYMNIMDFDEVICTGFKDTNMIMRQVIPLAFLFNIDDFLTANEKRYLHGKSFKIVGNYKTNAYCHKMYDFSIDYRELHNDIFTFNVNNGSISYIQSSNIFDMPNGYHESYLFELFTKNKMTPYISKWKLLQSTDSNPYIINFNYSFSNESVYGQFPSIIASKAYLTEEHNNIIIPSNDTRYYDSNAMNVFRQYINAFNTNWYTIAQNSNIDLSNIINDAYWSDVINSKSYYRGILYDVLNVMYDYNVECIKNGKDTISINDVDKFGVFLTIDDNSKISTNDFYLVKYTLEQGNAYLANTKSLQHPIMYEHFEDVKDEMAEKFEYVKNLKDATFTDYTDSFVINTNALNSLGNSKINTNNYFVKDENGKYINYVDFAKYNKYIIDYNKVWNSIESYIKINWHIQYVDKELLKTSDIFYTNPNSPTFIKLTTEYVPENYTGLFYKANVISVYDAYNSYVNDQKIAQWDRPNEELNIMSFETFLSTELKDYTLYEFVPKYEDGVSIYNNYYQKIVTFEDPIDLSSLELTKLEYKDYLWIDSYNLHNFIKMHNEYCKRHDISDEYEIDENILDSTPWRTAYIRMESGTNMAYEYSKESDTDMVWLAKNIVFDKYRNAIQVAKQCDENDENKLLYAKKKVYLFTNELFKLFKTILDTTYKQLYILDIETGLETCCRHRLLNDIADYHELDHLTMKYFVEDNLYIESDKRVEFASIFSNSDNFNEASINVQNNHQYTIYKYKVYDFDLFVNIDLLSEKTKTAITEGTYEMIYYATNEDGENKEATLEFKTNFVRYSLYSNEIIHSYDIDVIEYDNKKYLYLLIKLYCENNSLFFNIKNNRFIKFNKIDDKSLENNDDFRNYVMKYHNYFVPALKLNLFSNYLSKFSKYVISLSSLSFIRNNNARTIIGQEKNDFVRYSINYNSSRNNININRYFGDCTPLILEASTIPNSYNRIMIRNDEETTKNNISNKNTSINNVFEIKALDIYIANDIKVYNPFSNNFVDMQYFEYKHFNDSQIYNLEPCFEIPINKLVTEDELENYESTNIKKPSNIIEWTYTNTSLEYALFKDYVKTRYIGNDEKKFANNIRYEIHFLFLFNKYKVTRTSAQISTNPLNGEHLYAVKYKYELI